MRRVTVKAFGGAEQLTVEPGAEGPPPGPGQVLVDVEAAGVNYVDVYQRKGISKLPLPYTPGLEGVGRVREVGERVDGTTGALAVGRLSVRAGSAWATARPTTSAGPPTPTATSKGAARRASCT